MTGKKIFALLIALLLGCALLAGCASAPAPLESQPDAMEAPQATTPPNIGYGYETMSASGAANVSGGHKIIYNANLSLTTRQFDQTLAYIEDKIAALGGFIQNSSLNGKKPVEWLDEARSAFIQARIPADKSEEFLRGVQGEAEVESLERYSDDITTHYIDTKSRVDVLTIQLQRLKEILVTRSRLSDVLELEQEIARVTTEIEQLTSNLRQWENLVKYATVTVNLREINVLAAPKPVATDLGTRIREGFYNAITGVGRFLGDLVVFLISALPVLVLLAIIAAIIWLATRRATKHARARAEKHAAMRTGYHQAYSERFGMPPPPGSVPPEIDAPPAAPPEKKPDKKPDKKPGKK